jgi:hypothetical protein
MCMRLPELTDIIWLSHKANSVYEQESFVDYYNAATESLRWDSERSSFVLAVLDSASINRKLSVLSASINYLVCSMLPSDMLY